MRALGQRIMLQTGVKHRSIEISESGVILNKTASVVLFQILCTRCQQNIFNIWIFQQEFLCGHFVIMISVKNITWKEIRMDLSDDSQIGCHQLANSVSLSVFLSGKFHVNYNMYYYLIWFVKCVHSLVLLVIENNLIKIISRTMGWYIK